MSTASRHLATAPKHRIRQPPSTSQTCFPPLPRTALFRADTHASPRVILNLPQARHMPPRRLVMPTAAGRCRFHWRPFPASRIPAPAPKRHMRQPIANFSNTLPVAPLSRTALLRTDIRAAPWDPTETSVATAGHPFPAHPRPLPCPPSQKTRPRQSEAAGLRSDISATGGLLCVWCDVLLTICDRLRFVFVSFRHIGPKSVLRTRSGRLRLRRQGEGVHDLAQAQSVVLRLR